MAAVPGHAGGTGPGKPGDERACHGRTQWDAMTEATSAGRFRATRLALLISVRYGLRSGAAAWAICRLIEVLARGH
jgi:hypothetical protein